jgi:transcriptional regulator with XRE-family HTH domain
MTRDYARAVGARLRAIRQQQGLSLHGVEQRSDGRWKAVVVGSYERGDRAISVQRLSELAEFYGIPVSELLPSRATNSSTPAGSARVILDLQRLAAVPRDDAAPLTRFVATIQARRGDYNGRVLTIRRDDLQTLALLYDEAPAAVVERLVGWGVLGQSSPVGLPEPRRGVVGAAQTERLR